MGGPGLSIRDERSGVGKSCSRQFLAGAVFMMDWRDIEHEGVLER